MRRVLLPSLCLAALPGLVQSQDRPTLLDVLSPDVIVQRMVQSGILALRTQMDLQYSDLSVDLLGGSITITDVQAWPLPDWDDEGTCEIEIDRITVQSAGLIDPNEISVETRLSGLSMPTSCLPEEPRGLLAGAGLDQLDIPRATFYVDYGIPASDAQMRFFADISNLAVIDAATDYAYIWVDGREDMDNPDPVMFIRSASVAVENQGLWEAVVDLIPEPFRSEGAGLAVEGVVGQALLEANPSGESAPELSPGQQAFARSVGAIWPAFLENPQGMVIETNIDGSVYFDLERLEDDPREAFDTLNPVARLAPSARSELVSLALYQAVTQGQSGVSPDDTKRVGMALLTGFGAPRDIARGVETLMPLASAGDGEVAMLMAETLEARDPASAYAVGLIAARAEERGATALLDRLERALPLAQVAEIQATTSGADSAPDYRMDQVAAIRTEAAMRLSGRERSRDYGLAMMWARLGAAMGDAESLDIMEMLDAKLTGLTPEEVAAVEEIWAAAGGGADIANRWPLR